MKNTLAGFNFFYSILRPIVDYGTLNHYRSVTVRGRENLPRDGAYILAPCHQNALMDALLVLMLRCRPTVFLARADIFRKPALADILHFLRISPVYRIRDGRDQLSKNDVVFKNSREVLEHGIPLCLMAEGTHNDRHQLLPLVKGMFRIACETQAKLGDKPLYIVPVGLDYDEYSEVYSNVCVNIGTPIHVGNYMAQYEANEAVALNKMKLMLAAQLKERMHHVGSPDHYDEEYAYCHLKTQEVLQQQGWRNTPWNRFQARKSVSDQMTLSSEEEQASKYAEGAAYATEMRRRRIPLWFASKGWRWWKTLLALLGVAATVCAVLPVWKYWVLSNVAVYLPTHFLTDRIIKDPQFRSSVDFVIRLVLSFLNVIVSTIVFACCEGIWVGLGVALLGIVSAHVTPRIFILLRDVCYSLR